MSLRSIVLSIVLALVASVFNALAGGDARPRARLGLRTRRAGALTQHESQLVASVVEPEAIEERLDDVGGLAGVKGEVMHAVVLPLQRPKLFFGQVRCLEPTRGLMLVGPPGTGKTMLARAMAAEAGVPLLALTLSVLENKYVGESSKLLAAAFTLARKLQPCLVLFDEIDGMMRERSADEQASSYGFKTEFLQHMDALQSDRSLAVIVLGSTNNTRVLDPALKRRMPRVYHLHPPNAEERGAILDVVTEREPEALRHLPDELFVDLVRQTKGCTGSDLREAYRIAASARLRRQLDDASFRAVVEAHGDLEPHIRRISRPEWLEALRCVRASKDDADRAYCGRGGARSALEQLFAQ